MIAPNLPDLNYRGAADHAIHPHLLCSGCDGACLTEAIHLNATRFMYSTTAPRLASAHPHHSGDGDCARKRERLRRGSGRCVFPYPALLEWSLCTEPGSSSGTQSNETLKHIACGLPYTALLGAILTHLCYLKGSSYSSPRRQKCF